LEIRFDRRVITVSSAIKRWNGAARKLLAIDWAMCRTVEIDP
jgi:hypothetical protein